jgi:putative transposase
MPMRKYKLEQIVTLLRQVEVELANGKTTPQACKEAEITAQTYYRWRKEFGGLKLDQAKRLKKLEPENAKLNRLVAELSLLEQILRGCGRGKLLSPERRRGPVRQGRATKYRSGMPADVWSSGSVHNATKYSTEPTKMLWRAKSWHWPANTGATAIGGSRRCCGIAAGIWERIACNGSGDAKG